MTTRQDVILVSFIVGIFALGFALGIIVQATLG